MLPSASSSQSAKASLRALPTMSVNRSVSARATAKAGNAASIRVAERLGARRDPAAEATHGDAIHVYRHPKPETLG